jgi:biopolymer transport protein ExbD
MISSTFLDQPGIKLELPKADSSVVVEQKDYVLFVDKAGKMFLNDKDIALDNLEAKIKDVLPKMKDSALILKADQDVSHGTVVRIMDIVRKGGIKKLIIGTKTLIYFLYFNQYLFLRMISFSFSSLRNRFFISLIFLASFRPNNRPANAPNSSSMSSILEALTNLKRDMLNTISSS